MADPGSGLESTFDDKSLSDSQLEQPTTDIDGYPAMIWYGSLCIGQAFFALLWYLLGDHNSVIRGYF